MRLIALGWLREEAGGKKQSHAHGQLIISLLVVTGGELATLRLLRDSSRRADALATVTSLTPTLLMITTVPIGVAG